MIAALRRQGRIYLSFTAMTPKLFMAYRIWVWMEFIVQILAMAILVFFWRAVYASQAAAGASTLAGLDLQQTLNYILCAQILSTAVTSAMIFDVGYLIRDGAIGVELLRPVDMQARYYVEQLGNLGVNLLLRLPLFLIAILVFGLGLPSQPLVWLAFLLSLLLGHAVFFFFDWIFACLAFYSTEVWGLNIVRNGVKAFFGGALIPIVMMPGWLQQIAALMPFQQGLYIPVSVLTGITPLADIRRVCLVQAAWLVGLLLLSRWIFSRSVRKVTVQGG